MALEFITTEKNKQSLKHTNFLFYKDSESNGKIYWKCFDNQQKLCKARIQIV